MAYIGVPPQAVRTEFPAGSVTTTSIANSAVTTALIANNAVTTALINDGAVTSGKLGTLYTANISDISSSSVTFTNKTLSGALLNDGYTEEVYTLGTSGSIALDPANGTIQTCAASATVTFTDSLSAGQSIALRLTNGASYTINWPTTTWVTSSGNTAPTLTANDTLVFWKISTTLYGAYVGSGA